MKSGQAVYFRKTKTRPSTDTGQMPDEVLSLSTGGISEDLDIIWLEIVVPLKALFVAVCGAPLEKR